METRPGQLHHVDRRELSFGLQGRRLLFRRSRIWPGMLLWCGSRQRHPSYGWPATVQSPALATLPRLVVERVPLTFTLLRISSLRSLAMVLLQSLLLAHRLSVQPPPHPALLLRRLFPPSPLPRNQGMPTVILIIPSSPSSITEFF